jgi:DNA polymerase III delta subunit
MKILDFFSQNLNVPQNWVAFVEELPAYQLLVLKDLCRDLKKEFRFYEIKADGPSAELENEMSSLDFFSAAKVFYVHLKIPMSKWTEDSTRRWKKLLELSSSQGNWLLVSADQGKNLSAAPLCIENSAQSFMAQDWIAFFNVKLKANLSADRLEFLAEQEPLEFLDYKHWIELWALGGDEWAAHSLGWGLSETASREVSRGENVSYQWVDAALTLHKTRYLQLSKILLDEMGEDPIRLWALLGKSVKIISQLAMQEEPVGEPPFLVSRLKRVRYQPKLLDWWCRVDKAMKGGDRADFRSLMLLLPA